VWLGSSEAAERAPREGVVAGWRLAVVVIDSLLGFRHLVGYEDAAMTDEIGTRPDTRAPASYGHCVTDQLRCACENSRRACSTERDR